MKNKILVFTAIFLLYQQTNLKSSNLDSNSDYEVIMSNDEIRESSNEIRNKIKNLDMFSLNRDDNNTLRSVLKELQKDISQEKLQAVKRKFEKYTDINFNIPDGSNLFPIEKFENKFHPQNEIDAFNKLTLKIQQQYPDKKDCSLFINHSIGKRYYHTVNYPLKTECQNCLKSKFKNVTKHPLQ